MMKAKFVFPFLLLLLASFASCIQQDDEHFGNAGTNGRVLTVNYSFDTPTTRVTATGLERRVEDVAILFYGTDDAYVACQMVTLPTGSGSSGTFPVSLPSAIQAGSDYKLLLIGNYSRYKPGGLPLAEYAASKSTLTYPQMKEQIHAEVEDDARIANLLPFYGRLADADADADADVTMTCPAEGVTSLDLSVRFSRSVSRFDLVNLAADKLKIKWVKVCNYRDKGHLFNNVPVIDDPDNGIVPGTSTDSPEVIRQGYQEADIIGGRQSFTSGGLYAFPNAVIHTAQNDTKTTYLMIAAQYKGASDADYSEQVTYYRANVSKNGESQLLKRNYVYTLVVSGVKKAGATSESAAASSKDNILDYVVDDQWTDDGGSAVTDEEGNRLETSHESVILASNAGASALVKVTKKGGTGWELTWAEGNDDGYFRFEKISDNSFSIITTEANAGDIRRAKLRVQMAGVSSNLYKDINVTQLSTSATPAVLVVDGKTSNFTYAVDKGGATISMQIQTGSATCQWRATYDETLIKLTNPYANVNNPGVVIPESCQGANNGYLILDLIPNLRGYEISGTVTVEGLQENGETPDGSSITITFTQQSMSKDDMMKVIIPDNVPIDEETDAVVINAFNNKYFGQTANTYSHKDETVNGFVTPERFEVRLAQPEFYSVSITSNFNQTSDALVTSHRPQIGSISAQFLQVERVNPSTTIHNGNGFFWLNAYSMGPGDVDITRTIEVTATRRDNLLSDPTIYPEKLTTSFDVTLKNNCIIGDAKLYWYTNRWQMYIPDRNVGVEGRGTIPEALNHTYAPPGWTNTNGYPDDMNNGYENFLGTKITSLAEAKAACTAFGAGYNTGPTPTNGSWKVPDRDTAFDFYIKKNIIVSKGRYFILSEEMDPITGKYVGCWLPTGGNAGSASGTTSYWTVASTTTTGLNTVAPMVLPSGLDYRMYDIAFGNTSTASGRNYLRCVKY